MPTVKKSLFIDAPIDKVQEYCRMPESWSHWFVNVADIKNIKGNGEVGTTAEGYISILGIHFPIIAEVIEDNIIPGQSGIYNFKFTGALSAVLKGSSLARDQGVEIALELDYDVPGGMLGKAADALVVHRIQENGLVHTLENLKAIMETA